MKISRNTKEIVLRATDGLLGAGVNCILWSLYVFGASFGKSKTSLGAYRMFQEADEALKDFNYETFKQALVYLQGRKLIRKRKHYSAIELEVTTLGIERLSQLLPVYRKNRPWDGYLYLVSYDIAETHHDMRSMFRRFLKKIGCAMLQESLWVTPYTPRKLIDDFAEKRHIPGTILVSRLGKDGAIGEESFSSLIRRVYKLDKLNKQYRMFINHASSIKNDKFRLSVAYQRILTDDPQLPFPLLPKDWLGDIAYSVYQKYINLQSRPGR